MEKYKRLTDSETAVMLKNTEGSSWDSEDMEAQRYIRLAEIEDKIENGTLIELPCKVGDKMYKICPQSKFIKFGDFWDGKKVEHLCQKCGWYGCVCYDIGFQKDWDNIAQEREMKSLEYIVKIMPYVGTIWFLTKAEAEQRIKELQDER